MKEHKVWERICYENGDPVKGRKIYEFHKTCVVENVGIESN